MAAILEVVLQRGEIRGAVFVDRSDLAVEDGIVAGKLGAGGGDGRKFLGPVEAAPRLERHRAVGDASLDAVAVELDLMDPAVAVGRSRAQRREARRDEVREPAVTRAGDFCGLFFYAAALRRFGALGCGLGLSRGFGLRRSLRLVAGAAVGMPDLLLLRRDLFHGPAGGGAVRHLLQNIRIGFLAGELVAALDQKPRLLPLAGPRVHAHQMPMAVKLVAVQLEVEMALLHGLVRVFVRRPGALVPDHHRAAAILALGDDALELVVFDRMIFDVDGEPLVAGHEARPARHRPAHHHAIEFKPQIVMQPRGVVLLDDVAALLAAGLPASLAARLGSLAEVAFLPVGPELRHGVFVSLRAWLGCDGGSRAFASWSLRVSPARAADAISCCRHPRPSRCA